MKNVSICCADLEVGENWNISAERIAIAAHYECALRFQSTGAGRLKCGNIFRFVCGARKTRSVKISNALERWECFPIGRYVELTHNFVGSDISLLCVPFDSTIIKVTKLASHAQTVVHSTFSPETFPHSTIHCSTSVCWQQSLARISLRPMTKFGKRAYAAHQTISPETSFDASKGLEERKDTHLHTCFLIRFRGILD